MRKVVIVNAFDPEDYFIAQLSKEYEKTLVDRGITPEILYINQMNFSFTPFPEEFTIQTLEHDLRRSVEAMKMATSVAFFTESNKDKYIPSFRQFISRLFHLKAGRINHDIWGNMTAHNKVLRIITVLDDPEIWKAFRAHRNKSLIPVPKVSFGLFGFGQVYTRTFGFLKESDIANPYAQKSLKAMRDMAAKD